MEKKQIPVISYCIQTVNKYLDEERKNKFANWPLCFCQANEIKTQREQKKYKSEIRTNVETGRYKREKHRRRKEWTSGKNVGTITRLRNLCMYKEGRT